VLPREAHAADLPRHRLDFGADRSLPLCNQSLEFLGIISNWMSDTVFNPPAARSLVVRIRRARDGAKVVDIVITELDGAVLKEKHLNYDPAMECFKVLYASAFEAARLMDAFQPPPAPPPPPEPEPCPVGTPPKPEPVKSDAPVENDAPPKMEAPKAAPEPMAWRWFTGIGPRVAYGRTTEFVPGVRISGGRRLLPWAFLEADVSWMPSWDTRPAGITVISVETLALDGAVCAKWGAVFGCFLVEGGRFAASAPDAIYRMPESRWLLGVGFRGGAQVALAGPLSLRMDVDGAWNLTQAGLQATYPSLRKVPAFNLTFGGAIAWTFR